MNVLIQNGPLSVFPFISLITLLAGLLRLLLFLDSFMIVSVVCCYRHVVGICCYPFSFLYLEPSRFYFLFTSWEEIWDSCQSSILMCSLKALNSSKYRCFWYLLFSLLSFPNLIPADPLWLPESPPSHPCSHPSLPAPFLCLKPRWCFCYQHRIQLRSMGALECSQF